MLATAIRMTGELRRFGGNAMRRTLAAVAAFVVVLGVLVITFVRGWISYETMKSHYATYEDAVADGAVAKGWVPEFLPRSATDIVESHVLDTSEVWMSFSFDRGDITSIAEACEEVPASEVRYPRIRPRGWPTDLRDGGTGSNARYRFYRYDRSIEYADGRRSTSVMFFAPGL